MEQYQVIVLAAGQGKRMGLGQNKQLLQLGDRPLIAHTLKVFEDDPLCRAIYLVVQADEHDMMNDVIHQYGIHKVLQSITGGVERQDSVRHGVAAVEPHGLTFVHDGARPFVTQDELHQLVEATLEQGAALLATPVTDTVKQKTHQGIRTLDRSTLYQAQTPQAFRYDWLKQAHDYAMEHGVVATDDVALLEELALEPTIVEGCTQNFKLTNPEDIQKAENMLQMNRFQSRQEESSMVRIGQGFDVHQLVEGRPCIIGGVEIPYDYGLKGHSDADVLLHTIADAALGAIGRGDIGRHFPDDDPQYKGYDSKQLLQEVWENVQTSGYTLGNVDCTIMAQAPKMAPYVDEMKSVIAAILNAHEDQVNVKATTTEKLGFTGRKEGIAAQAVILLHETS